MAKYTVLAAFLVGCLLLTCFASVEAQGLPASAQRQFRPYVETQRPMHEDSWASGIWIFSPAANTTYTQSTLPLNIIAKRYISPAYYDTQLKYSINSAENTSLYTSARFIQKPTMGIFGDATSYTLFSGAATLPPLAQGTYNLTVYAQYTRKEGVDAKWPNMYEIQTILFTISLGLPPAVTLLPYNTTIESRNDTFTFDFVVDKPVNWTAYSLDGQANMTVTGEFALTDLPAGEHNITVYAMDALGNVGASETAHFKVTKQEPKQEQVWLLPVAAAIGAGVALGAGALILLKKTTKKQPLTTKQFHFQELFSLVFGVKI